MSKTPRADAIEYSDNDDDVVLAEMTSLSRALESELTELKLERNALMLDFGNATAETDHWRTEAIQSNQSFLSMNAHFNDVLNALEILLSASANQATNQVNWCVAVQLAHQTVAKYSKKVMP